MKPSIDEPQGYLQRLKPFYVRLFRIAHAIVGNLELSEYVLRSAIVEAYLRRSEWRDRMGFEEGLLHTVRQVSLLELKGIRGAGGYEQDWAFVPAPDPPDEALAERVERESDAMKRIALLYYGCDLTPKQIAQVMLLHASDVTGRLRRFNSRMLRGARLSGERGRNELSARIEQMMTAALNLPGDDVAEMGAVFRSFERDVDGAKKPAAPPVRIVGYVLKGLALLLAAVAFWLLAVLMQPSQSPNASPAPNAGQTQSAPENAVSNEYIT